MSENQKAIQLHPIEFREYRIAIRRNSLGYALALSVLLASLINIAIGYYRWNFAFQNYGPIVVWRFSAHWFWLGLLLALIGFAILIRTLRNKRFVVQTSRQAMIVQEGKQKMGLAWSEILAIQLYAVRYLFTSQNRSIRTNMILHLKDNSHLEFRRSLQDLDHLIETCKKMVYPRLLDTYVNLYNRGERVSFHAISLDRDGVYHKKKSFPWKEVQSARIERGKFIISRQEKGRARNIRIPVGRVYNADLCLQLVQEHQKSFDESV